MSTNCLVTKLKSSVDNDSLKELGVIKFKINTNGEKAQFSRIGSIGDTPVILEFEDGSASNYSETSGYINPYAAYGDSAVKFITNSLSNIRIKNKYVLGYFVLNDSRFDVDLSDFYACNNLSKLEILAVHKVKGNVIDICGKFINLRYFSIDHVYDSPNPPTDFSELNEFNFVDLVKAWISNGRSSSEKIGIDISAVGNNKAKFGNFNIYTAGAAQTLYWDSADKIYAFQKFDPTVYYVGYTQEEVDAKLASGGEWEGKTPSKCD